LAASENELQSSLYSLNTIIQDYNLQITTKISKVMAFYGKEPIRSKTVVLQLSCGITVVQTCKYLNVV